MFCKDLSQTVQLLGGGYGHQMEQPIWNAHTETCSYPSSQTMVTGAWDKLHSQIMSQEVPASSPTAVHRAFLFFDAKACPQSQTDLFTCTTILHCWHAFLRSIDLLHFIAGMHYGITLWAYLSELLVKDSHKILSMTEKPQYRVLQVT